MYWHTTFGVVGVEESVFYNKIGKQKFRPFSVFSGVNCRSYSMPLQKVITDFGADEPFNKINQKLKEHYGIEVPTDSARKITEHHGEKIKLLEKEFIKHPNKAKELLIAELDGGMVPIVEYLNSPEIIKEPLSAESNSESNITISNNDNIEFIEPVKVELQNKDPNKLDHRKHKTVVYKEFRLSLVHEKGSVNPIFGGTFGAVQEAGQQLLECAKQVGFDNNTKIHGVGDGAPWIAEQIDEQFGINGSYLIDFYHLCDYLAAAAPFCASQRKEEWMKEQKLLLKQSNSQEILINLKPYLESKNINDKEAPVRTCYRYIENRPKQFDYKNAIDNDLPIGSGEVESAHRYIHQKRMKISGAWWLKEKADYMISLRICRANNNWDTYWEKMVA